MSVSLQEFWEYYNDKTKGLIERLTDEYLSYRPYEAAKTLGEEIRHLFDSKEIYIRALTAKGEGPSWNEKRMDPETAKSVKKLGAYCLELEERYQAFFQSEIDWNAIIPWSCMGNPDKETALNWYIHFECTRQGVISTYLPPLGIDYDITG